MTASRPIDVIAVGETLALFRTEGIGPVAHNTRFELSMGGAESNVAIAVARLGGAAAWVGRLGEDSFGDLVLRDLRAEGVQAHATRDADAPTALMVREARTPSLARVTYYRAGSAGSRIAPGDLPRAEIRSAKILHVSGITPALSAGAAETVWAAIDEARAGGALVSFDVNHRSALWDVDEAAPVYRRLAAAADVVFAGEEEAAIVLGGPGDAADLAAGIAALGPSQVVIKLGADGCLAVIDGERFEAPGVSIDPLDTVGAGDAFVGGYLTELAAGLAPAARLTTANAAGAFACLTPGDWAGLPRRSELGLLDAADPVIR